MTYREAGLPPEVDRSILVACIGGRVYGIDRASGEDRWTTDLDSRGAVYVGFRHGVLVVSSDAGELVRLDYQTGKPLWAVVTSHDGRATIVIEPDVILCAKGEVIDCFNHGGRRLWSKRVEGNNETRIALGFPGNVAQADDAGRR